MSDALSVIWVILFILAGTFWIFAREKKSREAVKEWAARNGYRVLHLEESFSKGPFFWSLSNSQVVFRAEVRDAEGKKLTGWLRIGGWPFGLLMTVAEVRWDAG